MKHVDESQQRQDAIRRYLSGEKVAVIVRMLQKSRKWFYSWLKRYEADPDGLWWVEQSRAPHSSPKAMEEYPSDQPHLVSSQSTN